MHSLVSLSLKIQFKHGLCTISRASAVVASQLIQRLFRPCVSSRSDREICEDIDDVKQLSIERNRPQARDEANNFIDGVAVELVTDEVLGLGTR